MTSQLAKLARPFPAAYIEKPPKGKYGSYVAHHVINQALLATVGPFDLEVVEILRGYVPARVDKDTGQVKKEALESAIQGAVVRLTCQVDGRTVRIEEAGDCEDPHNWTTDGARLKDCCSDGLKRCAMRLGLGLHLWAQEDYFLYDSLKSRESSEESVSADTDVEDLLARELDATPVAGTNPPVPPTSVPDVRVGNARDEEAASAAATSPIGSGAADVAPRTKAWQATNARLHAKYSHDTLHAAALKLGVSSVSELAQVELAKLERDLDAEAARAS